MPGDRIYIGLATTFHDPALAIVDAGGRVLFAEATERFLQYKRAPHCEPDPAPRMASLLAEHVPPDAQVVIATTWSRRFCEMLERAAATGVHDPEAIAAVSPGLNRSLVPARTERALIASLHLAQKRAGLGVLTGLDRAFGTARIAGLRRYDHHLCHAASAAWSSPFEESACLVVDGMGETGASAIFTHAGGRIAEVKRHAGRVSIGFFYGLMTDLAGFDQVKGEEWKIMGLAPYGRRDPALVDLVHALFRIEGTRIAFADEATIRETVARIEALRPADAKSSGWADLSRVAQDAFEELMQARLDETARLAPARNLCLAGGCALNSAFNGKILARSPFETLHVPSAPADDGAALGAAWLALAEDDPARRPSAQVLSPYLGSRVSTEAMTRLAFPGARRVGYDGVVAEAAEILAVGGLVGWVQGRAEFGPRALGHRSILADPRPHDAKDILNAKVKYREAFRPFAPAILHEHGPDWFEAYAESPYMERTLVWKPPARARVPAVVHEDGTGRLQSVTAERNGLFHALLEAFHARTGTPILLNTSFNVMGKPILHTAEDAILMFATTGLDALVVEDWIVRKGEPPLAV